MLQWELRPCHERAGLDTNPQRRLNKGWEPLMAVITKGGSSLRVERLEVTWSHSRGSVRIGCNPIAIIKQTSSSGMSYDTRHLPFLDPPLVVTNVVTDFGLTCISRHGQSD
ncbi:hypothetical protein EVAR_18128_1 [Eumeta japonica]|uniref:Uncharacterized protein n=1 Tax=Eumeta variegata TaxID=151549 RepID=A0A4C1VGL0_EUMVA|nr:hypothetical protein EVAR_18128_1 [Eumeta japonica]